MSCRFLCLSDIHGELPWGVEEKGVAAWLLAGDICNMGTKPAELGSWAARRRAPVLFVQGNHDAGQSALLEAEGLHDISGKVIQAARHVFVAGVGWSGATFCHLPSERVLEEICRKLAGQACRQMTKGDHCIVLTHYPAKSPDVSPVKGRGRNAGYRSVARLVETLHPLAVVEGHCHARFASQGIRTHDGTTTLVVLPGPDVGFLDVDVELGTAAYTPWQIPLDHRD